MQANQLRQAGKAAVAKLVVGKTQAAATVAAGAFTLSWKVPEGYSKVTGVFFNPANDCAVTIYSENVASNIVSNFSTATGSAIGMIDPGHMFAEKDQLTATVIPKTLASTPQDLTIALRFE